MSLLSVSLASLLCFLSGSPPCHVVGNMATNHVEAFPDLTVPTTEERLPSSL